MPYVITATREQFGIDDAGQLQEYKTIYFRSALGDTGSIRILKKDFTADLAKTLVDQEIAELAALRGV